MRVLGGQEVGPPRLVRSLALDARQADILKGESPSLDIYPEVLHQLLSIGLFPRSNLRLVGSDPGTQHRRS
jgi:hypothetical protein